MADVRQSSVKEHYKTLASDYQSQANQTCEKTYAMLVSTHLKNCRSLLELGCGNSALLESMNCPKAVGCDQSVEMLSTRPSRQAHLVAADAQKLSFPDGMFEGVFLINLLEHVSNPEAVVRESARVLKDDGVWLTVTPNGNWEVLLDFAERWKMKIPEGPHSFLKSQDLQEIASRHLEIREHRTFLMFPAGPPALAQWVDRITLSSHLGWGFFQYLVGRKKKP